MAKEHCSCPVLKPSKAEFSMPFCDYIRRILRRHPDVGMFKVIPPSDWSPRKAPFPKLEDLVISCPIKQHVFPEQAAKGAYRCVLVEQKAMSVEEFRKLADSSDHQPPPKGRGPKTAQDDDDAGGEDLMERRFWSSLTVNPSVYGADNEQSCFDEKLKYGWNMRSLGDLLKTVPDIPDIPGVTTPMTYYGMWKAFFSWHTEDADLYSMNFLHFGAPKMWYCIAPQQRAAFEGLAQNLFPQLHRKCKGFLRHKDIMISPTTLRTHGIPFSQCKQEPGEFVVLNAAAYHSGFNMGFNCAEAVNFAMEDWIPIGKAAQPCTCSAMQDAVRINMRLFCDDSDLDSNSSSSIASRSSESCRSTCGDGEAAESDGEDEAASETSSSGSGGGLPPLHAAGQARKRRADGVPGEAGGKRARQDGSATGRWRRRQQHLLPGPARMKLRGMLKAKAMSLRTLREAAMKLLPSPAERGEPAYRPCAVVGEDDHGKRFWHLVRELPEEPVKGRGSVMVQELKEGSDGLWRLSRSKWEESRQALIRVRCQWMAAGLAGGSAGGFRLNTLRSRILSTDLEP